MCKDKAAGPTFRVDHHGCGVPIGVGKLVPETLARAGSQ